MYSYYRSLYSFPPLICEHELAKTPQYWTDQEVKKRKLSNQPGLSSSEIEILPNMDNIYFIFLSQRTEASSVKRPATCVIVGISRGIKIYSLGKS